MLTIWIAMFLTILISFPVKDNRTRRNLTYDRYTSNVILLLILLVLSIISGLRSSIGDTGYYMFHYMNLSVDQILNYKDWGYNVIQFLLSMINPHPQFIIIVTATVINSLILSTIYKHSNHFPLSLFLFFVSGTYIATMNGIRQYLVAAILFYLHRLVIEGNKKRYILTVFLLSTIHGTALIMIPVYYFVREKAWSRKINILIIIGVILVFSFDVFFSGLSWVLRNTQYSHYIEYIDQGVGEGAHLLRILVASVPVILGYLNRRVLETKMNHYNIYVNYSLLNLIVLVFASYNWIFARLGIYFSLFNLILFPGIIYHSYKGLFRILLTYLMLILYLIFFYLDTEHLIYASYFLDINRELIGPLTRIFY